MISVILNCSLQCWYFSKSCSRNQIFLNDYINLTLLTRHFSSDAAETLPRSLLRCKSAKTSPWFESSLLHISASCRDLLCSSSYSRNVVTAFSIQFLNALSAPIPEAVILNNCSCISLVGSATSLGFQWPSFSMIISPNSSKAERLFMMRS
jgi:hypothetical protein